MDIATTRPKQPKGRFGENPEFSLYGSNNYYTKTDTVFVPLSEVQVDFFFFLLFELKHSLYKFMYEEIANFH